MSNRYLCGLTTLGVELNPPYLGKWPLKIGQYMLNFGAIEMLSYQYLNALEATRAEFNKNLDCLLGGRIERILTLVTAASAITAADKDQIKGLWLEAKDLAIWRNRIAHNPVLPTWKPGSNSDRDPPDLIGVPDMRQIRSSDVSDAISLDGMNKLIDASADLGKRIHEVSRKLPQTQTIAVDHADKRRSS